MTGPRIGALFAGYGGLEMGVQSVLGGDLAWYCEIDKGALKILTHRHPDVPNVGDVTTVKWTPDCPTCGDPLALYNRDVPEGRGYYCPRDGWFDLDIRFADPDAARIPDPVEILTGGSPCQDLSHAGKRAGMTDGTRSNLWVAMREAIAQLRPGLVVWENVRGAYSAEADSGLEFCAGCMGDAWYRGAALRALGRVLGDLSDLGYDAGWHGLRAADVGAPHGRMRVFVVAQDAHQPARDQRWLTAPGQAEGGRSRPDAGGRGGAPTAEVSLLPTSGDRSGEALLAGIDRLLPTPTAADSAASGGSSPADVTLTGAVVRTDLGRKDNDRHASTTEARPGEVLRDVRSADDTEEVQREARGQVGLPAAADLLAELREHEGVRGEGHAPLAGQEAQGPDLSGLRGDEAATRSPRGPEPSEQRSGQPHDALRELPSAPALAGGPSCAHGCGSTCSGHSRATWGEYEAAIRRWEVRLGRPAPEPTRLSKKGTPQLAADFCEWMMGLPAGWVTDVPGITRNEALKALGNGVVPQQAEAALRVLLHTLERAA